MARNQLSQLALIVGKYSGGHARVSSGSLDDDFSKVLRFISKKTLSECLAVAFRSEATPPVARLLMQLYERSSRGVRSEVLNAILKIAPEVLDSVPSFASVVVTTSVAPAMTARIPLETVAQIVSIAESLYPGVVDAVSERYALRPSSLVYLDEGTKEVMLRSLATLETRGAGVTEQARPVEEAAPPPRYACAEIQRERPDGTPGLSLGPEQPFQEKGWYRVTVSVKVNPAGVPVAGERRPIREPKQTAPVTIMVTAHSDDFEITQPVSTLMLPPKGDSTEQATFRVSPKRHSHSANDLLEIQLRLFYKLNLIEVFTIRGEAVSSLHDDDRSRFGLSPAIDMNHERLRQQDANDFDELTSRCLHIFVEPFNHTYQMTFTVERVGKDPLAMVAPVALTAGQLEPVIAGSRKTLLETCSSDILGNQVDGNDAEFETHLALLSDKGSDLWSLLFDRGPDTAIAAVGEWLKENPFPEGSKIQVSIAEGASAFVFAWSLLYDAPATDDSLRVADGFWGMRYVIEQRVLGRRPAAAPLSAEAKEVEIGAMYWNFSQAPEQQKYLGNLLEKAKRAKLALGKPIADAATAYQCLVGSSSDVLYFYTHGHTGLPDGQRDGVTIEDFKRLYERLPPDSPTRRAWTNIYADITRRQYRSDESWIELSSGRIQLNHLYKRIQKLANRPVVILNMCDSAQVTPTLSQSFIDFFLSRGASAVIGTECPMRPVFADFVARELFDALFRAEPIGEALRRIRRKAAQRKNLLGLAYSLFGAADATLRPALLC